MANVIKNLGKQVEAWELGTDSAKELTLISEGKITKNDTGYELFSQEAQSGSGEKAAAGDFFKVDKAGFPYPNGREWFLANHRHIEGDTWEQLPKPLMAWEVSEELTPEIQFLIDNKGLKLSPATPDQYFGAELWGAWLTAASDAVLIFYSVTRDENGTITDADFNFVARPEFEASYHYC
jgi:hypothetical protein